jgi:hypothetical protein
MPMHFPGIPDNDARAESIDFPESTPAQQWRDWSAQSTC